jgi:2-oxoglutarate/2-oxoacid ferredoxin oxidoreductase subunit beta
MSQNPQNGQNGSKTTKLKLSAKDFSSDQDVRWCPGCGDYAILKSVQKVMPETGVPKENIVFVSGIGCSSRFPYYMETYGFHSIHGRAPAIASGLKVARPELSVWVITGDGDGLSIGGNHLLHALRRNMDLNIILFNNQIYGLTKGQYSPTSAQQTRSPSTPMGSIDYPVNPLSFALGSGATFVARCIDIDAKSLAAILARAHDHKGGALIEVLQNCPVFNDDVWAPVTDKAVRTERTLWLEHGKPLRFGKEGEKGIRMGPGFLPEVVYVGDGAGLVPESELVVHDEHGSPAYHFMLAQMTYPEFPMPMGVFRAVEQTPYDALATAQVDRARSDKGPGDLKALLHAGMTWEVGDDGQPI